MALKRYIGPWPEVDVRIAGIDYGRIEKGASVAVPDDLAEGIYWQPELWEDGADKPVDKPVDAKAAKDVK